MSRKAEPNIQYYQMKSNHTSNSKIKLLFNEFGSDGYWIWSCILDKIYGEKGYYFDLSEEDELELFASDVCKKQVSLVKEVVNGCLRRGLFDKSVFDTFKVLTSHRIQLNYLEATSERRRKGTIINFIEEFLLINEDETWKNVVVTRKNQINPRNNSILPRQNGSKENKIKENKIKQKNPPEELSAELFFSDFWELYDKKVGDKTKLEKKWNQLTADEKLKVFMHVPLYKISTPDKKFRKDPETYLNKKSFNDEIIFEQNGETKQNGKHQPSIQPKHVDTTENWGR